MTKCSKGLWLATLLALLASGACSDDSLEAGNDPGSAGDAGAHSDTGDANAQGGPQAGELLALSYNVAGLPELLSSSMPEAYTPLIGPLLNAYELVLLQESWKTPADNPLAPTRVYHEILEAASEHPHKSESAPQWFNENPDRPSAILNDGLNRFSDFPFGELTRVPWATCVDTASDCLATKGFSHARTELADGVEVDVYNLHMEAGGSPEDEDARDGGIDQLVEFMAEHSEGRAIIVGGDFNLHTASEPAASQFARLLSEAGLSDVCTELDCSMLDSIDKFLFRSGGGVSLEATSYAKETDVFVTDDGLALSDHDALAVDFAWSIDP